MTTDTEAAAELKAAIDSYHEATAGGFAKASKEIGELQGAIDHLHHRMAGLLVGGVDGAPSGGSRALAQKTWGQLAKGVAPQEIKAHSVGSDPEGGYVVPAEMATSIRERIFTLSPIRSIASVHVLEFGDAFEISIATGEEEAAWVDETAPRPETATAALAKAVIPLAEMYAAPRATQKLLDTAEIDVGVWLENRLARRLARLEAAAFITGDGVGKPHGFLNYPTGAESDGARPWGTLEHVLTGEAGAFAGTAPADSLVALVFSLKAEYLANACWLMARSTASTIAKIKDAAGQYLWQPALAAGQPPTLLGFPVVLAEDMPPIAAGASAVAFGDFAAGYQIVDGATLRLLRDPFTARPFVIFYVYTRVGGAVIDFDAIKVLKFAAA